MGAFKLFDQAYPDSRGSKAGSSPVEVEERLGPVRASHKLRLSPFSCATDGPAEGRIGGPPLYYRTAGPDAVTLLDFADFNDARGRPESARLARFAVLRPAAV
jgi:hypothetical protein